MTKTKRYIKSMVLLLYIAVFAVSPSCTREYQLKHNTILKQLVGKWECVWSTPSDNDFTLFFSNDNIEEYVGMVWDFNTPDYYYCYGREDGSAGGMFTLMVNGQSYEGRYFIIPNENHLTLDLKMFSGGIGCEFEIIENTMMIYPSDYFFDNPIFKFKKML